MQRSSPNLAVRSRRRRSSLTRAVTPSTTPEPRISFGGIISPNIGDDTPHGRANKKVMKNIVAWMDEHRDEIEGLDAERPLLPQFDLLTDEQIRELARSFDPLAG